MNHNTISPRKILLHLLSAAVLLALARGANPPELESAELKFQSLLEERIEDPFKAACSRLAISYLAALDREIAKRKQANDLDALVVLTDEKKRVQEGRDLAGDSSTDPVPLKELRKTWREAVSKPMAKRDQDMEALLKQYQANLSNLETKATQSGRVEDALSIRAARESIEARISGKPAETQCPPNAGKITASPLPDDLKGKPPAAKHTRRLIAWALAQPNARVVIRTENGQRNLKNDPANQADDPVPEKDPKIVMMEVESFQNAEQKAAFRPEWLLGETSMREMRIAVPFHDYAVLRGMDQLHRLEFHHYCPAADDTAFTRMPRLPALGHAAFAGSFGDSSLAIIADRFPELWRIQLHGDAVTPAGIAALDGCAKLTRLHVTGEASTRALISGPIPKRVTDLVIEGFWKLRVEDWDKLTITPGLKTLSIQNGDLPPGALAGTEWSAAQSLEHIALINPQKPVGRNLPHLNAAPALKSLLMRTPAVSGAELAAQPFVARLETLNVSAVDNWKEEDVVAVLRQAKRLERFHCNDAALMDSISGKIAELAPKLKELSIGSKQLTDACIVPLRDLKRLERLSLNCPGITIAGLAELKKLKGLRELWLTKHRLTPLEMSVFKQDCPDVKVEFR